jgi:tetratricopeptide (TPR) repeat protein
LKTIRETAARYPSDPFAWYFLSEAEHASGNHIEAEAAVTRLLSLQPSHVRGAVLRSLLLSEGAASLPEGQRAARFAEARALALRANKADPNEPRALVAYYQSFNLAGRVPPAEAIDALIGAMGTLPRDTHVRQLVVDRLVAQGKFRAAITALTPIASDPHPSPLRDAAREQMAQLNARLNGGTAVSGAQRP